MDEIDLLSQVRPRESYPDDLRQAARTRLVLAASAQAGHPARGRRMSRRWQAGLATAAAVGAAAAITATQLAAGTARHRSQPRGYSATQVLLLAADAASMTTPPTGARWLVWESQEAATGYGRGCGTSAKVTGAPAYVKLRLASCLAQPPATIPQLRTAKPATVPVTAGSRGYPDPAGLPGQPGPLLAAIYKWYQTRYAKDADTLPGHPAPPLTAAGLHAGAFDTLRLMLTGGVTSPSPVAQLKALALIPGITVVPDARNAAGRAGIAVTIKAGDPARQGFSLDEIIFAARTYQDIGGVLVQPDPSAPGGSVTQSSALLWQAYYDANGNRLQR